MTSKTMRLRFAPSPTGYLHIGGARTALFNWLLARRHGGVLVLRMEDTDAARNTEEARRAIFQGLHWLQLDPDEGPEQGGSYGPYSQSEAQPFYEETIRELRARDAVYPCFCTRERLAELREQQKERKENLRYDGLCRALPITSAQERIQRGEEHTFRLRVPEGGSIVYEDLVLGRTEVRRADIEDIILVRADGSPIYNLAVVVDDHRMDITHVLRGQDHQTNTFKQLVIYEALGWDPPRFGHIPLILAEPPNKGKLSKRHGGAEVAEYERIGVHPDAMINWLAMMGWSLDDKTEVISRDQLVQAFDLSRVGKSGAQFNREKLLWLSGEYVRAMTVDELAEALLPFLQAAGYLTLENRPEERDRLHLIARCYRERIRVFSDIGPEVAWMFADSPVMEEKALANLRKQVENAERLEGMADELPEPLPEPEALETWARAFAEREGIGFGKLVHPVRAALTGRTAGPGLFDCFQLLGRERCIARLRAGAKLVAGN